MNSLRKELRQLLVAPFAWAVFAAFLIISGLFFVALLISFPVPDLERYLSNIETTFIVVAPVIAMRSFAEERRTGVLEVTLAWPTSRGSLILGKYVANTLMAWAMATIIWLYAWILDRMGPVNLAKAFSGYLGLLLLIALFSAIALAISAKSSSPATAAFVGFGVLLGLWTLDFVPGWLGGRFGRLVSFLAPTTHLKASGRGVVDVGDAIYFVAGTVLGLVLAVLALPEPRPTGWRRFVSKRHILPLAGAIAVIALATTSAKTDTQVDLTPERNFTLTPQTLKVLHAIHVPIRVTGIVEPGSAQQSQIQSLVNTYQAQAGDITLEFVDPDGQPAKTRALGATTYGQMVIEVEGRREVTNDIGEVELTSAIQRVARVQPPNACFTVGHGERSIDDKLGDGYSRFSLELRQLGYEVSTLAIAAADGVERLRNCRVVVVAGPRSLFELAELAALQELARFQGRLIVITDVAAPAPVTSQLNDLITPWGMEIRDTSVTDGSSLINDPGSIVSYSLPSQSPVTADLRRQHIPLLFVASKRIDSKVLGPEAAAQAWLVPLVESSTRSQDATGRKGPFVLAALTDWSRVAESVAGPEIARTRIAVVGSAEVGANQFVDRFGNLTFATSLVSWVGTENDIIAAARDPSGIRKLAITEGDRARLIREAIVLPALLAAVVFAFALVRVRRG
jgi:ABC-type transport system involved in cytochrome c biogenesis permease component